MQKLSLSDYPGTPAIVLFLQGCNFNCPFCHNSGLLPAVNEQEGVSLEETFAYLHKRRSQMSAVVISGGEPTVHKDLIDFIGEIKALGYKVKLDTNGSNPKQIDNLLHRRLLDYIAMDIKAPWQKYDLLAGTKVQHEQIKKSIHCIADSGIDHHFRTTHYPPMLSDDDLAEITSFLPKRSKYIVQPFKELSEHQ